MSGSINDNSSEGEKVGEEICCPRFNPEPWDEKEIQWENKLFVKDVVKSILHIPLNYGKVMTSNSEKIEVANASPAPKDYMTLSYEKSAWGADIFIAVTKDVPDANMVKISGTFLTKVFEGPYSQMKNWMQEMDEYVKSQNKEQQKQYAFYTTCPKCAKKYEENYVVLLTQV
ncbi:MAG: hypothetical protein Q8P90_05345 [bacterium]|nr:hypothetical protein [bacterium]